MANETSLDLAISGQPDEVSATPIEAQAIWQDDARKALDAWAETYLHDSPLSRDTQKHNEVYSALAIIRGVLDQL